MLSVKAKYLERKQTKKNKKISQRNDYPPKRALGESVSVSFKGSLALEASLVMPIFMLFLMTILMALEIVRLQSNVIEALHQGESIAYSQNSSEKVTKISKDYFEEQISPYICVKNNTVNWTDGSSIERDGIIRLLADYEIKPFVNMFPISIKISDSISGHGFCGYIKGLEPEPEYTEGAYVYITRSGTKYHLSEDCMYLNIRPIQISYSDLSIMRNKNGGKYYPCERCRPLKTGNVYITEDGSSYHSREDCYSLRRTIRIVPIREALDEGYSACSKCG